MHSQPRCLEQIPLAGDSLAELGNAVLMEVLKLGKISCVRGVGEKFSTRAFSVVLAALSLRPHNQTSLFV